MYALGYRIMALNGISADTDPRSKLKIINKLLLHFVHKCPENTRVFRCNTALSTKYYADAETPTWGYWSTLI